MKFRLISSFQGREALTSSELADAKSTSTFQIIMSDKLIGYEFIWVRISRMSVIIEIRIC